MLQDHSRSFAGSATDEEKYRLYMAATGFDAVQRGLAGSEAQVVQWRERLKAVQEQLAVRIATSPGSCLFSRFSRHPLLCAAPLLLGRDAQAYSSALTSQSRVR